MTESTSFISLLLVLGLAFAVPLILNHFKQLRLPVVVGEIIAGIIVGKSGFGVLREYDQVLDLMSMLGFVFLMFLSGMEINFSSLHLSGSGQNMHQRKTWSPLSLALMNFVLTLALAMAFGLLFAQMGLVKNPWMMALILSTTSLGVVMPILKEGRQIGGRFGQTVLISAMVADFATMLLITILVAKISGGLALDVLYVGILFVMFFLVYRFGTLIFNRITAVRRAIEELSHASIQIKVRAAFMIMLTFVALSEVLGTEVILGAFLAGAVVSLLRTPDDASLGPKLEAIGFGFFIPIFFIMVGANFNISALFDSPRALLLFPLLIGAAIAAKLIPALVFRLGFSWRETFAAGSLLSARLSLIIAASAIGLRLGIIGEAINAAIILVAIITVTASPLIFVRLIPKVSSMPPPILIASGGELGLQVAERLHAHGEPVVVVSAKEAGVKEARQRGLKAVLANLDRSDPNAAPYLEQARAIICTSTDMEFNYSVCKSARLTYGIEHVIVQVNDMKERARFEEIGVLILNPALDRVAMFATLGRNPSLYRMLERTDDDREVAEVIVRDGRYAERKLAELPLPGDLLVLAVNRHDELLVPHGKTRLQQGDQLTLFGSVEAVAIARQMFA